MISLIDAGPGTGKSWILKNSYKTISRQLVGQLSPTPEQREIIDFMKESFPNASSEKFKVCFFSHGKEPKKKLEYDLKKTRAKVHTLNGAGYSVLIKKFGFKKLINNRTEQHIAEICGKPLSDMKWDEKSEWLGLKRLCHYLKTEAMKPSEDAFTYLNTKYHDLPNYTFPNDWLEKTEELMYRASIIDPGIEYVDQIWLGKKHAKQIYDLGLVDESQDISNSTFQLVTRLCRNVIFCGDKNQAINAFAGASEEMYEKIREKSEAVLPLKVTQRCPVNVCNEANAVRPGGVLPGPNKHRAIIKTIEKGNLLSFLSGNINPANTLLLARTNATIVNTVIWFHEKGIPFTIIDKDLKKEIQYFIKKLGGKTIAQIKTNLAKWWARMERSRNKYYRASCKDKYDYILRILSVCKSPSDIANFLEEAFEDRVPGFKVTTVHKAKGLEAPNIFLLNTPIPLPFAMEHPIGREQELNLDFVAKTRSSADMYYVE